MTNLRVDSEPAFVLHTRPYRETSQLVDLFSRHYGRLRVVARGFRRPKNGSRILAPFTPLLVGWSGKSELKTLVSAEHSGRSLMLSGERLYSGFYLNELLIRLLVEHDPQQYLFDHYLNIMTSLADGEPIEPALRLFERNLLDEAGYGLMIDTDIVSGHPAIPDGRISGTGWIHLLGFPSASHRSRIKRHLTCFGVKCYWLSAMVTINTLTTPKQPSD